MTLSNILETFEQPGSKTHRSKQKEAADSVELDQARSDGFETGYASGWEDARKADSDSRMRIEAEFERNIQNLAFTYSEAVDRVRGELKMFVGALLNSFLPEMAPDLLREHVRAELLKLADELIDVPIEIVTSRDCAALIGDMLQSDFALKVELAEDESLAPSQVFIRVAEREVEVNLAPLLSALKDQFKAVSKPEKGVNVYG